MTVDDVFNQGTQILASIKALAAGQTLTAPLPSGPISLTQANSATASDPHLSYSFDGKTFKFSKDTPFGPMLYSEPWNGQL